MLPIIEGVSGAALLLFGLNRAAYQGWSRSITGVVGIGSLCTVGFLVLAQAVVNYSPVSADADIVVRLDSPEAVTVHVTRVQLRDCDPVVTQMTWIGNGWSERVEPPRSGMFPPRAPLLSRASYSFTVPAPSRTPESAKISEVYDCGARQLLESSFSLQLR